jgi:hypothetical protein
MPPVAGIHRDSRSAARQVYALEAARLSFMAHARGTAEHANLVFSPLPRPWSISMADREPSLSIQQALEATGVAEGLRALPPPDSAGATRPAAPWRRIEFDGWAEFRP